MTLILTTLGRFFILGGTSFILRVNGFRIQAYGCMHACMHACMYVCMQVCRYVFKTYALHVNEAIHTYIYIYVYMHKHKHLHMHIPIYIYIDISKDIYV